MPAKEKRKFNPRRRTLIRLLLGVIIIAAVLTVAYYTLRPTGAQIVFIAPDDNGVENLWIADLNNPEHPRQLTFHDDPIHDWSLQVSKTNHIMIYKLNEGMNADNSAPQSSIWLLDIKTGRNEKITSCDMDCIAEMLLSPNGEWLAYVSVTTDNEVQIWQIVIESVFNAERRIIEEFNASRAVTGGHSPLLGWVGETNHLAFRRFEGEFGWWDINDLVLYNIETDETLVTTNWFAFDYEAMFSLDGLRYATQSMGAGGNISGIYEYTPNIPEDHTDHFWEQVWEEDGRFIDQLSFEDWHPDEAVALVRILWFDLGEVDNLYDDDLYVDAILYDMATYDTELLFTVENFYNASFNYDGSQILFNASIMRNDPSAIFIYDVETRKEIALPLFGRSPQWVNGGR